MILLDTAPLVAAVVRRDQDHERAKALIGKVRRGLYGEGVSTDYILDEGLTLIQSRWHDRRSADVFASLFHGARERHEHIVRMQHTGADILEEAVELHFKHYDRGLSVTDCTLIVHARRLDALIATFDSRFAGLVPVVDA